MPILQWLTREKDLRAAGRAPYRLLEEIERYGDGSPQNMLIQGDNLETLKALLPYYAGKVKCIYIDPPYNTRSAFEHYNDNLEHTQWLSMMYPRLGLLREFLSEDGSIFVSIDDREGSYLKIIMDEIFGRSNFVTTFIWRKVDSPNDNKISICPDHEFIHCYAKNIAVAAFNKMNSVDILSSYTNKDEKGRLYRDRLLRKNGKNSLREDRPTMWFPIVAPDGTKVWPIRADGKDGCWAYSIDGINNLISSNRLIWKKSINKKNKNDVWIPYSREFAPNDPVRPYMTIWMDVNTTRQAKSHHKILFKDISVIDTIKPEELICRILNMATNPGDLVLDSFLGSGTTAAVAHKMGRHYIGIEMGDHAVTHCIPRLKKVVDGTDEGGITYTKEHKSIIKLCKNCRESLCEECAEKVGDSVKAKKVWFGGGGFRFYKLGESIFDEDGAIREQITFAQLAAHVWFCETGEPLSDRADSPLLGVHEGTAYYLLYNGILGDKKPQGGNVLTRRVLESLPPWDGPKVLYGERNMLSPQRMKELDMVFKQTPYDIKGH